MTAAAITGCRALTPDGWCDDATIVIEDGRIADVGKLDPPAGAHVHRADGLLALPGIVDVHGDGFERCLAPRPGIRFPIRLAVADTEHQLLTAGITTFFWSITDSFEPGLRSREVLRELVAAIGSSPHRVDHRLHLRHEWLATDGHDELVELLTSGRIHIFSINDHGPESLDDRYLHALAVSLRARTGPDTAGVVHALRAAHARRPLGDRQVPELLDVARRAGLVLASHDDDTVEFLDRSLSWGVDFVEFPGSLPLAERAERAGAAVLMGAPNAVRGTSHAGFADARDAAAAGLVDMLCSDYHFPSLFAAPFVLDREGVLPLSDAWRQVSEHPARLTGLHDRGTLEPGRRADLVLVRLEDDGHARLTEVWSNGRPVATYA